MQAIKNDIALNGAKVYAQDFYGEVYCIDAETGIPDWKKSATIYGAGHTLTGVLAVDAGTLAVIRQYPAGRAAVLLPPYAHGDIQTVECSPQIRGNKLIFAGCDGSVRFYDKQTADFDGNVTKFTC